MELELWQRAHPLTRSLIAIVGILVALAYAERHGNEKMRLRDEFRIADIYDDNRIVLQRIVNGVKSEHVISAYQLGLQPHEVSHLDWSVPLQCGAEWRRGFISQQLGHRHLYEHRWTCDRSLSIFLKPGVRRVSR